MDTELSFFGVVGCCELIYEAMRMNLQSEIYCMLIAEGVTEEIFWLLWSSPRMIIAHYLKPMDTIWKLLHHLSLGNHSPPTYVTRTLRECGRIRVGSSNSSAFLKDPTRVRLHFGESTQHSLLLGQLHFLVLSDIKVSFYF